VRSLDALPYAALKSRSSSINSFFWCCCPPTSERHSKFALIPIVKETCLLPRPLWPKFRAQG
jgi:hypothetical protein